MILEVPIQIKRGLESALPAHLLDGRLYGCEDSGKLFMGLGNSLAPIQLGGSAQAVSSVFGRTGAIIAQSGDYSAFYDLAGAAAAALVSAKAYTDSGVAGEASSRSIADGVLAGLITSEASTRSSADTTLQGNITAEASSRASGDSTNASAISAEATRALAAEALLAPQASPTFTGTVTIPTPGTSDNSTKAASTAFVKAQGYLTSNAVSSVFGRTGAVVKVSGDYAVADVTGAAPLASPSFTGSPVAPTPTTGDSSTLIATTAFVKAQGYLTSNAVTSVAGRTGAVTLAVADVTGAAPLASPTFTGSVTITTATTSDNSTLAASTAFVKAQGYLTSATDAVPSVFGRTGAVVAVTGDYTWDFIGSAAASKTFNNAAFTTTFNQTSAAIWLWANTTAATAGGTVSSSPIQELSGQVFTLGVNTADIWSMQGSIASIGSAFGTITQVSENSGSVVTLTVSGTYSIGQGITPTGLTTATWLNNINAVVASAAGGQITFADPTSHGTQASHAETGTVTLCNPISTLAITHSGSPQFQMKIPFAGVSGLAAGQVVLPAIISSSSSTVGCGIGVGGAGLPLTVHTGASGSMTFLRTYTANSAVSSGNIGVELSCQTTANAYYLDTSNSTNANLGLRSNLSTTIGYALWMGNVATFAGTTAGEQVAVAMGGSSTIGGNVDSAAMTFAPASGATTFCGLQVKPTINQTSTASGNYTGIRLNVVETSLKGTTNLLLDLQAGSTGGTSRFNVDNTGLISLPNSANAGFGAGSAGTAMTTTTKGAGSGPTTPQTVVQYAKIVVNGTTYWFPLVQ